MAIDMKHQPPEDRREAIARAALSSPKALHKWTLFRRIVKRCRIGFHGAIASARVRVV